uniref:Uncharacterized protein n=1 Tax=Anguilla anguilla TaxID=7936 RepID=A0A0E9Y0I0_ANGAN
MFMLCYVMSVMFFTALLFILLYLSYFMFTVTHHLTKTNSLYV